MNGWNVRQQEELITAVQKVATQLAEVVRLLQTIANRLPAPTQQK